MNKLDLRARKALPSSDFAVPAKAPASGSYPVEDSGHAKAALSRVAANGSPAIKSQVKAKVKSKFPNMKVGGLKGALMNRGIAS